MALKKCKECGEEISSSARKCPKCGKKQNGAQTVISFILTIIILVVISGAFGGNNSNLMSTGTNPDNQEKFTLEEGHIGSSDEYGISYKIEGTIKNNTDKQYNYVQVTFNLYDKDGAQIGSALANINNLEANGLWKFKAIGSIGDGKSVDSYKLIEITGF